MLRRYKRNEVVWDKKPGKWKIKHGTTPQRDKIKPETVAATKVCRVCLAIGVKMYHITEENLLQMYEIVTGLGIAPGDRLPKMFCWECVAGLRSANKLKEKAITVHHMLSEIVKEDKILTVDDIERLKSGKNISTSNFSIQVATDHYDLIVKHDSDEVKEEYKLEVDENVEYLLSGEELDEENFDLKDNSIKCEDTIEDSINDKSVDSDFTLDNIKSDNDFNSDSDYNKPVKRILRIKKEIGKTVGVKGVNKNVKNVGVVKKMGKGAGEKKAGVKTVGIENHGGVKKEVVTVRKEVGMMKDLKDFTASQIIERLIVKHDDSDEVKEENKLEIDESVEYLLSGEELDEENFDLKDNSIKYDDTIEDSINDKSVDSDFTLDNIKSDNDFSSDSDYNKPVKRILRIKKEIDKIVGVKGVNKNVGVVKKVGGGKKAGVKTVGIENHGGVKKEVVTVRKEVGMMKDLKDFTASEIIERYRNMGAARRSVVEDFIVTELNIEDQISELQSRQESMSYQMAPYKCTICFRGYKLKAWLDAHSIRHSEKFGDIECFICKRRFKDHAKLRRHITVFHTEEFACRRCDYVTRSKKAAVKHLDWHEGKTYICSYCNKEFGKFTSYMNHIRIKHSSDFICELCGYSFVSKRGIDIHRNMKHRDENYEIPEDGPLCEPCNVKFVSEKAYQKHLSVSAKHNDTRTSQKIRGKDKKYEDESNSSLIRNIPCEQCGVLLEGSRAYHKHFRREHPDKNRTNYPAMKAPCMCEVCGKMFQHVCMLRDHHWTHTDELPFACEICGKRFSMRMRLVAHKHIHGPRAGFTCDICGKSFSSQSNCARHKFGHTGLKPFKCETCGKCFKSAVEKKAHVDYVHLKKPWPKRTRTKQRKRELEVKVDQPLEVEVDQPLETEVDQPLEVEMETDDVPEPESNEMYVITHDGNTIWVEQESLEEMCGS